MFSKNKHIAIMYFHFKRDCFGSVTLHLFSVWKKVGAFSIENSTEKFNTNTHGKDSKVSHTLAIYSLAHSLGKISFFA